MKKVIFLSHNALGDTLCITCALRAFKLGNVKEKSLLDIWHDTPYEKLRHLSNEGRLCERDLCAKCGDNRYGIDGPALQNYLQRQAQNPGKIREVNVAEMFERVRAEDMESMKLGLIR